MFNEWTLNGTASNVASSAINALKVAPAQNQPSVWSQILGAGLQTAGQITAALASRNNAPSMAPNPYYLPNNRNFDEQARQPTEEEIAARRRAIEEESSRSDASIRWTDKGLQLGASGTLSPTTLGLIGLGLYLLFREPPRRGRG